MVSALRPTVPEFTGRVVTAGDHDYDQLRAVWNAMHDRRPASLLRCGAVSEIVAAIGYARANELEIAIRGGGHSVPGHGVCDGGVVIDLRPLNHVVVDPVARRVTVGGGALLGDLDRETQRHGMVVPAGVISHTGVGGLTLGGGVGRLMRRFGLTIDSLLSAEVVTADGRVIRTDADSHPELFWAIRGGGGNFGVVAEFEFRLHELSELIVLRTFHRLSDAHALMARAEAEMGPGAPDELLWSSFFRKGHALPWMDPALVGEPGILSHIEWSGPVQEGHEVLSRLQRELDPAATLLEHVPFSEIQREDDELFRHGNFSYIKASFADEVTPDLVSAIVEHARKLRSSLTQIELISMGGAIHRVPVADTAFAHRGVRWLANILATWPDDADTAHEVAWSREAHAAMAPMTAGGTYVNFMDEDEIASSEWTAFGPTLERLRQVKARYDPENVFHLNQNIPPAVTP